MHVFLSGAGGRTGKLVQRLLAEREHKVVGLVRRVEQQLELPGETIVGDILRPETYTDQLQSAEALIILSSAVPRKVEEAGPPGPPKFYYKEGQYPEQVDWEGQKNQIDAAKGSNVKHIVLVGSMGATKEDHMLNRLGNGNILIWKRKSQQYLIETGIPYTVINPGGLTDAASGERELLLGKADNYMNTDRRTVPRADLAHVIVQALHHRESQNKAFDLVSKPGQPPCDWSAFFGQTTPGL